MHKTKKIGRRIPNTFSNVFIIFVFQGRFDGYNIKMANVTQVHANSFINKTLHTFFDLIIQELKFGKLLNKYVIFNIQQKCLYLFIFIDEVVDSWMFMRTPWPMFIILTAYLLFVLKLGPQMMKNREPFEIKHIVMIYNLTQTAYNMYIISMVS